MVYTIGEKVWVHNGQMLFTCPKYGYTAQFSSPFSLQTQLFFIGGTPYLYHAKKNKLRFRLDIRLLIFNDDEIIADGMTGEVARVASKGKLYGDRLKSVLATKCHLNNLLSTISHLNTNALKSISVPVVQIMGLDTHVFILKVANRGIYTFQEVCSFRFPVTSNSIKNNVKEIVDGLSLIEVKKINHCEYEVVGIRNKTSLSNLSVTSP